MLDEEDDKVIIARNNYLLQSQDVAGFRTRDDGGPIFVYFTDLIILKYIAENFAACLSQQGIVGQDFNLRPARIQSRPSYDRIISEQGLCHDLVAEAAAHQYFTLIHGSTDKLLLGFDPVRIIKHTGRKHIF